MRRSTSYLLAAVAAALATGCTGQARAPKKPPEERVEGPVVARYGGRALAAAAVEARMRREPRRALE